MSPKALLSRLPVDPYVAAIIGMVGLATALPAHGGGAVVARYATNAAIALLFFLHGARLSPQAALAGAWHWRLHVVVLASTFVLFPVLGSWREGAVPGIADAAALDGRDPALRPAFDGPIVDRVHLDRPRQRAGRDLRRDRVEPAGHGIDAIAGRALARRAGGIFGAWRGRHRAPASGPLRRRPACSAVDRRTGPCGTRRCSVWSIADRSCWWSMPRSARA